MDANRASLTDESSARMAMPQHPPARLAAVRAPTVPLRGLSDEYLKDDTLNVLDLLRRETWMDDAACVGKDVRVFFTEAGSRRGGSLTLEERQAKRICSQCEVRYQCLDYGLDEPFGIFGGMTPAERLRQRGDKEQRLDLLSAAFRKQVYERGILLLTEGVA